MSGMQFTEFENKKPMTKEERINKLRIKLNNLSHHLEQVTTGTESFRGCDKKACWDYWQHITNPTQEQKILSLERNTLNSKPYVWRSKKKRLLL